MRRGGRVESFTGAKSQLNLERLIEISRDKNRQVLKDAFKPFHYAVGESLSKVYGILHISHQPPPITKLVL